MIAPQSFGNTGLTVSKLGLGCGHIGSPDMEEHTVAKLLHTALDRGITLFDTARGYGLSEERMGNHLASRRQEIILSTKVGYGIDGFQDWTYDIIIAGVHSALKTLKTDYIDIVHLHSCPLHILEHNGVLDALERMRQEGKIRVCAYSGENQELTFAASSSLIGSLQTSINIFDQYSRNNIIPHASGKGVIAKRPLGNCPWKYSTQPYNNYAEKYWQRMRTMGIDFGENWADIAIRFSAWHCGAHSVIAGSSNPEHIENIAASVERGPLQTEVVTLICETFEQYGKNWPGEI